MRAGVIGVGYWGPNLVRTLSELEGVQLSAVADMRPGRREFIAKRYPQVRVTADAEDIINDRSIHAVFIATPPDTHHRLALAALQAGKHVLVEKPLTLDLAEAEEIVALADEEGLTLAVGHLFLYHPAVAKIRELLNRGELGDLYFVSSTRCNLGPPQTKVDVLWDLAPHDVAIVLDLMGEAPVEATARGARFLNREFVETAYINLAFASGRMAQVNVSWLTPNKTRNLQVVCSQKTIVYDDMEPVEKVRVFDAGQDNRLHAGDTHAGALGYGPGSIIVPALAGGEPLRLECQDFIQAIANHAEPVSSGRRALEVVRVLETASRSIYSRLNVREGAEV